jgi:hypothetical protein
MAYDVESAFTYHPPFGNQAARYVTIREHAKVLAKVVLDLTPGSAEQTLALRRIEEAVMWANASIARNEVAP